MAHKSQHSSGKNEHAECFRLLQCFSFNVIVIGSAPSSSILLRLFFSFLVYVFAAAFVVVFSVFLFHSFRIIVDSLFTDVFFCSFIICALENRKKITSIEHDEHGKKAKPNAMRCICMRARI